MLNIPVEPPSKTKDAPVLLYVGKERHARFSELARSYNMQLVELFDKVLEALEANQQDERGK